MSTGSPSVNYIVNMKQNYVLIIVYIFLSNSLQSQVSFEDQASTLGIDVATGNSIFGNGVSFYDFDNDGWDDISLTTESDDVRFYKNINGSFVEQDFGLPNLNYETKSVTWVDFDNDGDKDLFITSETGGNKLFENIGNMAFQDITSSANLPTSALYTDGATWGDYNNDGNLDVFLSNRTTLLPNKLYQNNGDGTFSDVSFFAGIDLSPSLTLSATFLDINNDGFQDIYVANDRSFFKNKMYKNNGDGTYDDISMSSGTDIAIDAMTVTVGDFNRDSFFDIYITNNESGNYLLKNNGDETFTDVAVTSGTIFNSFSWGAVFFDANNDKDIDLYVAAISDGSSGFLPGGFYLNNGNETFNLNNASFPNDSRESYSNAVGDIDNDGLLDLVVTNLNNDDIYLWKNTSTLTDDNWIKLKLTGTASNKDAVGSIIEISIDGEKQYRYTHCGEGYLAQNSGVEHFGVGDATELDYVKVTWLSGIVEIFNNVPVNQLLSITEGNNTLDVIELEQKNAVIFPNPATDIITINTEKSIDSLEIVNMLGQTVYRSKNLISKQLDLSFLSEGQYIVLVNANGIVSKHKLLKI